MKKSILFLFAFIPLFASCNQNSNGFVNPFPEDEYHPIGFNFGDDERINRPLTTTEQALVASTTTDTDDYIMEHTVDIQSRDYTRAFAGEFEKGYSSSNILKTENRITFRQVPDETSNEEKRRRTVTDSNSTVIYDYSYGRNASEVTTNEWHYYAFDGNDPKISGSIINAKESENPTQQKYIVSQIHSTEASKNVGSILATNNESSNDWDIEEDIVFSEGLNHSEFLTKLSDCSSTPGADKQDNVILVKEDHTLYGEDKSGIYALPDGRTYQAMVNTITISRLTKQTTKLANDVIDEWYLVSYARRYSETTITSEIIQPNVPIQMLANPIVINYTEEKHTFKTKTNKSYTEAIDPINIEVLNKI